MEPADLSADADVFGRLANETRLRILLTVWEYRWRERDAVTYAELQDLVGIEDSGKFSYHLDKLRGEFVREEADGYVPTWEGWPVVRAVRTRRLRGAQVDPELLGSHCPRCGERLAVDHAWQLHVGCSACQERFVHLDPAPSAVEARDSRSLALDFARVSRRRLASFRDGVCPDCGGETSFEFARLTDTYARGPDELLDFRASARCATCFSYWTGSVGRLLYAHPAVREYADDHGIDLEASPFWEYEWLQTDLTTSVRSADPRKIEKVATMDGRRLAAVFDGDGAVETITHVELP